MAGFDRCSYPLPPFVALSSVVEPLVQ